MAKMKNIILYFIVPFLIGSSPWSILNARAIKSADYASASNYLRLIQWNFEQSGKMPHSWADIGKQHDTMPNLGDYPYSSSFGFLPPSVKVDYRGSSATVVVMSIDGKGVGRMGELDQVESGRLIVLHHPPDSFEVLRIAERDLEIIFRNAGHDLRDYTGVQGKWINLAELGGEFSQEKDGEEGLPSQDKIEPEDRSQSENGAGTTGGGIPGGLESDADDGRGSELPGWLSIFLLMVILVALIFWSIRDRQK